MAFDEKTCALIKEARYVPGPCCLDMTQARALERCQEREAKADLVFLEERVNMVLEVAREREYWAKIVKQMGLWVEAGLDGVTYYRCAGDMPLDEFCTS